jgi:hypothetical protein
MDKNNICNELTKADLDFMPFEHMLAANLLSFLKVIFSQNLLFIKNKNKITRPFILYKE